MSNQRETRDFCQRKQQSIDSGLYEYNTPHWLQLTTRRTTKQLQLEVLQPDYKKQEVLVKKTISYSSALVLPFGKYLRVGKPLTPNLELRVLSASASTLAITTSSALAKASPSFSYVGARALQ